MGMYDTIRLEADHARELGFVCATGHPLVELQTKELENTLNAFTIHQRHLYRHSGFGGSSFLVNESRESDGARLAVTRSYEFPLHGISAIFTAHEFCLSCEPVLIARSQPSWGGELVNERWPMCDFRVTVEAGRITKVECLRADTTASMRKAAADEGSTPLADDDSLAVAHRAVRAAKAAE